MSAIWRASTVGAWAGGGAAGAMSCPDASASAVGGGWRRVTATWQRSSATWIICLAAAESSVDLCYLVHPPAPVPVLQVQHVLQRPVEVVRQVGYLLVETVEGVAYDSPEGGTESTSNLCPHSGQAAGMAVVPFSLI